MKEGCREAGETGRLAGVVAAVVVVVTGALTGVTLVVTPQRTAVPVTGGELAVAPREAASPANRPLPPAKPVSLEIPAIGLATGTLAELGQTARGAMEVPGEGKRAGWYTPGPAPGETGPSLISGHAVYAFAKGVFDRLHEVRSGDVVRVGRADGSIAEFEVYRVEHRPRQAEPATADDYTGTSGTGPELRLVTCAATYDRSARTHTDEIVVSARLS
ncbi:sortase domain-containing protein [Amycolatopsis magusensis]|uniref:sortase domain-containing protein n=1 Tax=Amycolatopsis magusensis TaxID=882444 RepID=UPI0037AF4A3F